MRRLALVPTLIAALLLPSGAHALGLGEIEIQSALNQRLDAEIPLRGVPAGQSDEIEVSLASEEAFNNVGLDRPFALTRLRFNVEERNGGYYVHITSRESIVEPFLSFLVEVDWSGGNLLREYTVLLDPPVFASEDDPDGSGGGTTDTARTSDAGDDAGVTGEIERDAESGQAESGADDDDARSASGSARGDAAAGADKPVFLEVEEREERARAEAEAERAAESGGSTSRSAGAREQYGPVGDGETLWSIASRLKSGDMTVQQMMIALLRYNPDAFAGENVNRLKQGYVLRVPDADRVLEVSAQQALARVREQNGVWRELQDGSRSRTSVAASDQGTGDAGTAAEGVTGSDDAELSIVGADDGGASSEEAASPTGSSSGDDSEKLQLAREQLESTRLEKEELESRVDELEQTVSKMEKLLEVRDERLSALQNELRELEGRQADGEGSATAADEEAGTDVASAEDTDATAAAEEQAGSDGESVAASEEDDETVAATDGDGGEDAGAGTTAADGGSGDGDTTVAANGESASGQTESADAATSDGETEAAEATASAGDEADGPYIPEDKQATEADRGVQTTRTQEPEETWLDQVNGAVAAVTGIFTGVGGGLLGGPVGLGLAAAVILLGGGLMFMRRRRLAAESDDLDAFDADELDTDLAPFDADSSGQFAAGDLAGDGEDAEAGRANARDAQSALMEEEFDVASLDEEQPAEHTASGPAEEPSPGTDEEEAEKDDTVAEADVYLAYGLHQQSEDLLRLALREQPGNTTYREKLLETLYASGKTEEFIEEAETFRDLAGAPESRLWQRVLAMGRDLAPRHELFAEGDTQYTVADVQPTRPEGTDLDLDDADGEIDFGFDDGTGSAAGSDADTGGDQGDDDFSSTLMLDSSDSEAVEGDGGLVGPDESRAAQEDTGAAAAAGVGSGEEEDDLEFDLGDLDALSEDEGAAASSSPGSGSGAERPVEDSDEIDFDLDDDDDAKGADGTVRAAGDAGDGELDFDLEFDDSEGPTEGMAGIDESDSGEAEAPARADSDDGGLDFDFDLGETAAASSASTTPDEQAEERTAAEEPADSGDDEPLEIGDLEIGDLDSLETEPAPSDDAVDAEPSRNSQRPAEGEGADSGTFDLSDLDTGVDAGPEQGAADETIGTPATGGEEALGEVDTFDLSDLDAMGGVGDDDAINLDEPGTTRSDAPEPAEQTPPMESRDEASADAVAGESASRGTDSAPEEGEDEEFDTMLDLARAYIDMGDPESAANALEEVAASGNEQQRSEAQSLLDSVR